eukprot:4910262-Karenia_brevis.AAC.1
MGACRSMGDDCKSVARLLCPAEAAHLHAGWDTAYIRGTCMVKLASDAPKVLGVYVGSARAAEQSVDRVVSKVSD